jgi:Dolichyl-phosphate-mannose-protein mannosyltransferase
MSAADYLAGVLWLALSAGPIAYAATRLLRRRLGHLGGAMAVLAWSLLFTAGIAAEALIPGVLGILTRGTVVLTALALAAVAFLLTRDTRPSPAGNEPPTRRGGPLSIAMAVAAAGLVAVYVVAFWIDRRGVKITSIDALTFGLPTVTRWVQDDSVWSVGHYAIGWAFGAYPNNGELVQLGAVLPWRSDAFVRFVGLPYLALTGVAVYALARQLRAPWAAAVAWGAAVVAIPASLLAALEYQKTDIVMLACFVAGVAFLVRHSRSRLTADLVMGGLGLGLAFGTRWYGVSAAAAVVVVWIVARALARHPRRDIVRQTGIVIGLILLGGGFWLLRNWIEVGDPFFPVKVAPLGVTIFDAPPDLIRARGGFSLLHYATDTHVWRVFLWPQLRDGFALPTAIALVACVVGLVGLRRDPRTAVVAVAALVLAAIYVATPYTAQGAEGQPVQAFVNVRYGVPAAALGAAVAAALGARGRLWTRASTALGLIASLDALARMDNAGAAGWIGHVARPSRLLEALVALALVAAFAFFLRVRALRPLAIAGAAFAAIVIGYLHEHRYTRTSYATLDPAMAPILGWHGRTLTVGVTGEPATGRLGVMQPLAGPHLNNRVRLLGTVVRHTLHEPVTRGQLAASLGDGYDVVFVMRPAAGVVPPDARWVYGLGYRPVASGATAIVFTRAAGGPALP